MAKARIRNRSRLRRKQVSALATALQQEWGLASAPFPEDAAVDEAELEGRRVWLFDGEIIALEHNQAMAPAVRGLLKWPASRRRVVVDMGAVRFVTNGADIMTPGITDATEDVAPGMLVWIAEERHGKPLGVGQALLDAQELRSSMKGRGVKAVHYLGDPLWDVGHEDEAST